ncbi:UDP-N-acetylmuramate--L-alanine ligase [Tritrichomonas foetus]|uniref:UDP-N-acetylmuramate--L-alanine ligase n=1 Tax=Tritrichomonas foetus TaxID=1144522 RepID=A0A1J4KRV4_9EUKA|nr:UDP-N-acetylmuramate--L-alanine ligase [Tritrichomonas foetus]|eukprot:OHT12197.1 UDP-N-acetylmuramate--L-alanine ligase [Tritrichomonas foetus]
MDPNTIKSVYFIGIGGIGMSAIARYFLNCKKIVGGFDKLETEITKSLIQEGAHIHYDDNVDSIPDVFKNKENTLIIYTPAIPSTHSEFTYFNNNGFEIQKRAQVLGTITRNSKGICVAGTHGKTTTSTLTAHLFDQSHLGCNAFVGGISKNFNTNFLVNGKSEFTVIEADEYDRSFHTLSPLMTVITAVDADHLDIYHDLPTYIESFEHYTSLIVDNGVMIIHTDLNHVKPRCKPSVKVFTYSTDKGDFHAENIRKDDKGDTFIDWVGTIDGQEYRIKDIKLGISVPILIENSVAAIALAHLNGVTDDEIRAGMLSFKGVQRRFDFQLVNDKYVFLNDYGHHPVEVRECIKSIREMYKGKKITVAFQPHLFSRTKDSYMEFAEYLALADEIILLDIFPAREQPMEGVTSHLIFDNIDQKVPKMMCKKDELVDILRNKEIEVLICLGAGDIDTLAPSIVEMLNQK